jgi:hypothetical protein
MGDLRIAKACLLAPALLFAASCTQPAVDAAACEPACGAGRCDQADGCGGTCRCEDVPDSVVNAVATTLSCASCPLRLSVVSANATQVVLSVAHVPAAGSPLPRMIDVRVTSPTMASVSLVSATLGAAAQAAGKELFIDPQSGEAWKLRAGPTGEPLSYQLLLLSLKNAQEIGAGEVLRLTLSIDALTSVRFNLIRRKQIFAPLAADSVLASTPYDGPITIALDGVPR